MFWRRKVKSSQDFVLPESLAEEDLRQAIETLYQPEENQATFFLLQAVADQAVPLLVEALDAPRTASTRFDDRVGRAKSAFERICRLLKKPAPPAAVAPLAKFVEHEDNEFRKQAAYLLAYLGTVEAVEPVRKALADEEDYVRSYATMGMTHAIEEGRGDRAFFEGVFESLTKLLDRSDGSVSGDAPNLLLAIDRERAIPVLLSPQYFRVGNREVHYILRALNQIRYSIPHASLLPFLDEARGLTERYPHDYHYAEALRAYAIHPDDATEATLRGELAASNEKVSVAAGEALADLFGVSDARDLVFTLSSQQGAKLTGPQRRYLAVVLYDTDVNNGGHSQYFWNSFGEAWQDALDGLDAIGAEERAAILKEVVSLFGKAGPSTDREIRWEQLERLSDDGQRRLRALDDRYYACKEVVDALLARYTLEHREDFASAK